MMQTLTANTLLIVGILALLSLACWAVMLRKFVQFRTFRKQCSDALSGIEAAADLHRIPEQLQDVPEGCFTRILDRGMSFYEALPRQERSAQKRQEAQEGLEAALATLRPQDQQILRLFYGLDGGAEHSLDDIGALLGLSAKRVRQLRDRAIAELSENRREAGLELREQKSLQAVDLEGLRMVMDKEIGEARGHLASGLILLVVAAAAGPLLGLLGTVTGIMATFIAITQSGSASIAAIAPGVSEALVTTVAGLLVALPAAVAHHMLSSQLDQAEEDLYGFANELANHIIEASRS